MLAPSISASNEALISLLPDGSVSLKHGELSESEKEGLRKTAVSLLHELHERKILPFSSPRYPHTKGVLDRVPFERFIDHAAAAHTAGVHLDK